MNVKTFEQFSPRDQEDLRNVLLELQKLEPPKQRRPETNPSEFRFDSYEFFLGRAKQFRITRIK